PAPARALPAAPGGALATRGSAPGRGAGRVRGRFDLFSPTAAARERSRRERPGRAPRFRPLRLDRLLGPLAIRPPDAAVAGPTLAELSPRQPLAKPDGRPARWTEAPLRWLESVDPDGAAAPSDRRRDGHWHADEDPPVYHAGPGRGLAREDAWLWLSRLERRWWALPDAGRAPWLRHRGRWWTRERGVWFVLHEGEAWAWRRFARWEAEGLIHPGTGTAIVYSADFARAAVVTPGRGAVLFDAVSGAEIARWSEAELPPRWRPAPRDLTLPAGI
ncbi:MAG: hypothetical protein SF051_12755, partial [Elusimicrobiota bacterium]|nr:hypothetical protein [Elusimicrobiota bacterium]